MINRIQNAIATLSLVGYIPFAPGTFGTAVSFLFVVFLKPGDLALLLIFLTAFLLGLLVSHNAEKTLGKDSRHIVIDEFCGYLLSILFIPKDISYLIAGFILFRFFDVLKPPPIRKAESAFSGGMGIMVDDILAAIYSNGCIQLWRLLF
ncbi:MAG: phosphatidylglycerophosphatase A [Nitrospirae bacterium]|nr:phosphatidylglycerophosphatase A [Nitrospirota bacterium]